MYVLFDKKIGFYFVNGMHSVIRSWSLTGYGYWCHVTAGVDRSCKFGGWKKTTPDSISVRRWTLLASQSGVASTLL